MLLLLLLLLHVWKEAVWHQRLVGQRHRLLLLLRLLSAKQQAVRLTEVLLLLHWPSNVPRSRLLRFRLLVRRQIQLRRLVSLLPDKTFRRFV